MNWATRRTFYTLFARPFFLLVALVIMTAATFSDVEEEVFDAHFSSRQHDDDEDLPLVGILSEENFQAYERRNMPIGKLFVRGMGTFGGKDALAYRLEDAAERFPSILFVIVDTSIKYVKTHTPAA